MTALLSDSVMSPNRVAHPPAAARRRTTAAGAGTGCQHQAARSASQAPGLHKRAAGAESTQPSSRRSRNRNVAAVAKFSPQFSLFGYEEGCVWGAKWRFPGGSLSDRKSVV